VVRLAELGPAPQEAIYAETLALGRPLIPALIQLAYDPDEEIGAVHAIAILRALLAAYPEELAFLAPWLDQAEGDWYTELLSNTMGKVGGFYFSKNRQEVEQLIESRKNATVYKQATQLLEKLQQLAEFQKTQA
jgi:hypothetical protein